MVLRTSLLRGVLLPVMLFVIAASGCSSGGGGTPPPPAPSGLTYPKTGAFVIRRVITPLNPTVTGTVSSYSVAPGLPAGIMIDPGTGVISGVPTAVSALASYTVTATNPAGSTTATVALEVDDVAPAFSYPAAQVSLTKGVAVQGLAPMSTGGLVVAWSISPALPTGLTFNASTGIIGGAPTSVGPAATYVVTAQNSGGQATASLTLGVHAILLDLGHSQSINALKVSGSRVLSMDLSNRWVLWDFATATQIASGTAWAPTVVGADLEGPTLAVEPTLSSGIVLRSSSDGSVTGVVATVVGQWKLATDGSYICGVTAAGLAVWSSNGTMIASRPGDYNAARIFAAPGQVQVALGPAGANVIETIAVPSGTSSVSAAFQGQFNSWFVDGGRFFSNTSDTLWIYDNKAVQQDVTGFPVPGTGVGLKGGQGNWFWTFGPGGGGTLNIYKVGASSTPAASYTDPFINMDALTPSGMTLGVLKTTSDGSGMIIDLSGSTPKAVNFTAPFIFPISYSAASASQWVIGYGNGLFYDGASLAGTPRNFGFGAALSITGSPQRVAVATALGPILFFNPATQEQEGMINFPSGKIEISSDGSSLAALAASGIDYRATDDSSVRVFSLPAAVQTSIWQYTPGTFPTPYDVTLSGSGKTLGQILDEGSVLSGADTCVREVMPATGGLVQWSDTFTTQVSACGQVAIFAQPQPVPIRLSPDGTLIAVSDVKSPTGFTTVYNTTGTLVFTAPGWVVGWLDNSRLLVNSYASASGGVPQYQRATIYSIPGPQFSTPPLPELQSLQVVTADTVYDPGTNAMYSLTSGAATWNSAVPDPNTIVIQYGGIHYVHVGAIAGSSVVSQSGAQVVIEPY